jgi:hypothetical protein
MMRTGGKSAFAAHCQNKEVFMPPSRMMTTLFGQEEFSVLQTLILFFKNVGN